MAARLTIIAIGILVAGIALGTWMGRTAADGVASFYATRMPPPSESRFAEARSDPPPFGAGWYDDALPPQLPGSASDRPASDAPQMPASTILDTIEPEFYPASGTSAPLSPQTPVAAEAAPATATVEEPHLLPRPTLVPMEIATLPH